MCVGAFFGFNFMPETQFKFYLVLAMSFSLLFLTFSLQLGGRISGLFTLAS